MDTAESALDTVSVECVLGEFRGWCIVPILELFEGRNVWSLSLTILLRTSKI